MVILFVTLCTRNRRAFLADSQAMDLIMSAWKRAEHWMVGRFVILPDHIYFFCAPGVAPMHPLQNWMSFWRNHVTRNWNNRVDVPLWQTDFWDRQLRRGESYDSKWEYVRNNPVRHGLVERSDDWPYQGELNRLEWHDA